MSKPEAYIVCTSPRSGSTLLCTMLRDSAIAGHPQSLFHRPSLADWRQGLDLADTASLPQILSTAIEAGTAGTGMFGLRLQRQSAPFFFDQITQLHPDLPSNAARLQACFGTVRYIYLYRQDKVAQAVSLVRAEQSGLWHRKADGSEYERTGIGQALAYDAAAIAEAHKTFQRNEVEWRNWFDTEQITPLHLTYEDMAENPIAQVQRVLDFLGCDATEIPVIHPALGKLADETSAAWVAQFRATIRDK